MDEFLSSLNAISLTNDAEDPNTDNTTNARRRMLAADIANPTNFLQMNAFIFLLIGVFLAIYLFIYIFQRNIDSCCGSCPKLFFYVNEICEFMKKRFMYIYVDFVLWLAYIPFLYFALIQLKDFNFDNFLNGFSSLLSILFVVVLPLYPFFICYLLKKNYNALVLENDNIV